MYTFNFMVNVKINYYNFQLSYYVNLVCIIKGFTGFVIPNFIQEHTFLCPFFQLALYPKYQVPEKSGFEFE